MPEKTDHISHIFTVSFDALAADGRAIGHLPPENDGATRGLTVFCEGLLPGETAEVRILSQKKNYATAECIKRITSSPDRIEPFCPVFPDCGGCTLQHLSYEGSLAVKREHVISSLIRIGKQSPDLIASVTRPILGMPFPYDYRNHMQYPVGETIGAADAGASLKAPESTSSATPASTLTSRQLRIGLYSSQSHMIVPHKTCRIAHPACESVRSATESFCLDNGIFGYDEAAGRGFLRHLIVRVGVRTGEVMVILVGHVRPEEEHGFPVDAYVEHLKENLKKDRRKYTNIDNNLSNKVAHDADTASIPWMLKSVWLNCNPTGLRQGQTVSSRKENQKHLWGKTNIREIIGKNTYTISPLSFFQVNTAQAEILYDTVRAFARSENALPEAPLRQGASDRKNPNSKGSIFEESSMPEEDDDADLPVLPEASKIQILVDMYCGTGSIGLHLARNAGRIIGIENSESAVHDARDNAARNGIEHATYIAARAEDIQPADLPKSIDCIIVDPPRSGCDPKLLAVLLSLAPAKIIYVSCDPATLSRDVAVLAESLYSIKAVQPVDLFSWSGHVETVVLMVRVEAGNA
jgi:23S rRNA (uracil1939-C5)-methyltransferase